MAPDSGDKLPRSFLRTSYTDEATSAKLADARLSDASKQVFKDVTIGDKPLAKWVKDWQAVARQLGEVHVMPPRAWMQTAPRRTASPSLAGRR